MGTVLAIVFGIGIIYVITKVDKNVSNWKVVDERNHYRAQKTFLLTELMVHIEEGGHIFMSYDTAEIFRENGLGHLVSLNEKNKEKEMTHA